MSYIRCISNPEGLYIWSDRDGKTYLAKGSDPVKTIPSKIFKALFKKYKKEKAWKEDFKIGAYRLREVYISPSKRTFSIDGLDKLTTKTVHKYAFNKGIYQWRISGPNWKIDMWEVTLEYIAAGVK